MADGGQETIEAEIGESIMQAATNNMIEGLPAECGGNCSCATCHCYIDPAMFDKLEPAGELELEMLGAAMDPKSNSRLTCQLTMTAEMDGMVLEVPEE